MTEESDARIERMEKASQDQQGQLVEITELLKTLVRDKAQAAVQQNSATQPEQRREDLAYPQRFTPPVYACTAHASNEWISIWVCISPNANT